MLPGLSPVWTFPGHDASWAAEFEHFAKCVDSGGAPNGSLADGMACLEIIERLYRTSTYDYRS